MDNFNLKEYLAEGKLKENFEKCNFTENDIDEMQETAFFAGWNLGQKGVGKGSLYSSAESAFEMWNSESRRDLAENKLEEVDAEEVEYMGERGFYDGLHTNMVDFLKNNINSNYLENIDELTTDIINLIANRIK
tara:strand:- start:35 stop:436 length:402 start_codon:yes stop_codon:yes gene_type:complete